MVGVVSITDQEITEFFAWYHDGGYSEECARADLCEVIRMAVNEDIGFAAAFGLLRTMVGAADAGEPFGVEDGGFVWQVGS